MRSVLFLGALLAAAPLFAQESAFFKTSDGVKIHYLTMGGSGSWVVLVHGYTDTAQRMWFTTGIAPALAKKHRVVALDNRNHGESDKPEANGPGRAQDVVELMDHLKIAKAHIHGYSMGGALTGQLLAIIVGKHCRYSAECLTNSVEVGRPASIHHDSGSVTVKAPNVGELTWQQASAPRTSRSSDMFQESRFAYRH